MRAERVTDQVSYHGEGPVWWPRWQKLRFVGNTSLAGAKLTAISASCYDDVLRLAAATTYFELSTDGRFMDEFVSASFFPHTDVDKFPTVMKELEDRRSLRQKSDRESAQAPRREELSKRSIRQ